MNTSRVLLLSAAITGMIWILYPDSHDPSENQLPDSPEDATVFVPEEHASKVELIPSEQATASTANTGEEPALQTQQATESPEVTEALRDHPSKLRLAVLNEDPVLKRFAMLDEQKVLKTPEEKAERSHLLADKANQQHMFSILAATTMPHLESSRMRRMLAIAFLEAAANDSQVEKESLVTNLASSISGLRINDTQSIPERKTVVADVWELMKILDTLEPAALDALVAKEDDPTHKNILAEGLKKIRPNQVS